MRKYTNHRLKIIEGNEKLQITINKTRVRNEDGSIDLKAVQRKKWLKEVLELRKKWLNTTTCTN